MEVLKRSGVGHEPCMRREGGACGWGDWPQRGAKNRKKMEDERG